MEFSSEMHYGQVLFMKISVEKTIVMEENFLPKSLLLSSEEVHCCSPEGILAPEQVATNTKMPNATKFVRNMFRIKFSL